LLDKGIPADHIITFSYNDVASSSSNPFPNTLYNKPTTGPGKDFNAGCVIDYQKGDVTPANYISVLKGDAAAMKGKGTGRVL
jgi:legumain